MWRPRTTPSTPCPPERGRWCGPTTRATPVSSSSLPCGDITPTVGITGTPVLDPRRNEIFAVADELKGGLPSHLLVGLNAATGAVELNQAVDPPGANTAAILQRTGLNLSDGQVVFGFGGNDGDCSIYHGWVVSVPETGGVSSGLRRDRRSGRRKGRGAGWEGAAPVVDQSGNVWVSTGNGNAGPGDSYDGSDSVIELSPQLSPGATSSCRAMGYAEQLRPGPRIEPARPAFRRHRPPGGQGADRLRAEPVALG